MADTWPGFGRQMGERMGHGAKWEDNTPRNVLVLQQKYMDLNVDSLDF